MSFVVAAAGARDAYQVPIALLADDQLARLVTDFYSPDSISKVLDRLQIETRLERRRAAPLPSAKVKSCLKDLLTRSIRQRIPSFKARDPREWAIAAQDTLSVAALNMAVESQSDLFVYAGYAHKAFRSPQARGMIKGLFQYHPHIELCARVLLADLEKYPALSGARAAILKDLRDKTNREEVALADFVVCASSFTARSLAHIGAARNKISVVPYGVDVAAYPRHRSEPRIGRDRTCRFLFVGSGIHRKGLHHLFEAWSLARLSNARLTVVARTIDPQIGKLAAAANIEILGSQTKDQLEALYQACDVFVLPALVEGFGYVYLEALARGCFCIGTHNTGLPDLAAPDFVAMTVEAGDLDQLAGALRQASRLHLQGLDRDAIRAFTLTRDWAGFRAAISSICRENSRDEKKLSGELHRAGVAHV